MSARSPVIPISTLTLSDNLSNNPLQQPHKVDEFGRLVGGEGEGSSPFGSRPSAVSFQAEVSVLDLADDTRDIERALKESALVRPLL